MLANVQQQGIPGDIPIYLSCDIRTAIGTCGLYQNGLQHGTAAHATPAGFPERQLEPDQIVLCKSWLWSHIAVKGLGRFLTPRILKEYKDRFDTGFPKGYPLDLLLSIPYQQIWPTRCCILALSIPIFVWPAMYTPFLVVDFFAD